MKRLIIAALASTSLIASVFAEDQVFRVQLPSPILFGNSSGPVEQPVEATLDARFSPSFPSTATAGQSFASDLVITGGKAPYAVNVTEGTLPSGIVWSEDRTSLNGAFLSSSNAFTVRVSGQGTSAPVDIRVPAIEVLQQIQIDTQPVDIVAHTRTQSTIDPPVATGLKSPHTISLIGPTVQGVSVNSSGVITLNNPAKGRHGPYRYAYSDAAGRSLSSNNFYIDVNAYTGMRLNGPGGWQVLFDGWTAAPANLQQVEVQSGGGAMVLRYNCAQGTAWNIIFAGAQAGSMMSYTSGSATCNTAGKPMVDTVSDLIGQPLPVKLSTLVRGTIPASGTAVVSVTWTKITD